MSRPDGGRPPITVLLEDPRLPYPYQPDGEFSDLDRSDRERLERALSRLTEHRFEVLDRHEGLAAELAARRPRFVFNLCDTGLYNRGELEAHIPALLEICDIPYSGAAPAGLLLCRDKALTRAAADELGVPVPAERYLDGEGPDDLAGFPYPAVVKPNLEEGSRGLSASSVVDGPAAATARLAELRRELPGAPLLLQEFLPGAEISVGLIGNPGTGLRPALMHEVDYRGLDADLPPLLTFELKNQIDPGRDWRIGYRPPRLGGDAAAELERHSRRLFARLGCRDYARLDFRADAEGTIKLLEVNPNPAWVWQGSLHAMAAAAGHGYEELIAMLLDAALTRAGLAG